MNDLNGRYGYIVVSRELIEQNDYFFLKALFSEFFPTGIEVLPNRDVKYYGQCLQFEKLTSRDTIPQYYMTFKRDPNDADKVIIVKVSNTLIG